MKAFDENGFLKDVVLIGSWCLTFYEQIFEGFTPSIRTIDVDFYVPNAKFADPKQSAESLKNLNYDHIRDTLTNKSKFISPDGFEIEFITKLNREGLSCVRLGKSGLFAESLSYVDMYSTHFVEIEYEGLLIKVASPSAFVIQKALINDKRGVKAEKDLQAIKYVASFIKASVKESSEFCDLINSLPKKWKKNVMAFFNKNSFDIPEVF